MRRRVGVVADGEAPSPGRAVRGRPLPQFWGRGGRTSEPRVRGVSQEVEAAAKRLRKSLTPAETVLWDALRRRQIDGLRFRRQQPLGRFILDSCCLRRRLVIEVDGGGHVDPEQRAYDAARTEHLQVYGYRVLRFTNDDVLHHLDDALDQIEAAILSTPPPELGEGSAALRAAGGGGLPQLTGEPRP